MKRLLDLLICNALTIGVFPIKAFSEGADNYNEDLLYLGSYEQELDDSVDESAEHDIGLANLYAPLREIDTSADHSDKRCNDTINKRSHDRWECSADDDTDGHVHYIASADKLFEFL